ncbi:MAG: SDR family oxidoreductase [Pseudomonadota bacterium]|nr:SDR family oxidoreductase [Pseudomonadota bacterium]
MSARSSSGMTSALFDLTGKVAIITGISRGIGYELAHGFAAVGAAVVGCARTAGAAEKTAGEIRAKGGQASGVSCDVTKPADIEALVQQAVGRYEKLDVFVCNAAVNVRGPAIDFTSADFDTVIDGNLKSYFLCAQAAARQFIKQGRGGAIVLNSSTASLRAFEALVPYCAAKGGVDMLVRGLAAEWGPHGIRVNAFNPGYTDHSMTEAGQKHLAAAAPVLHARTPLRRYGKMSEMVGPAIFLASDAASFVTGVVLPVDGGWTAL